MPGYGLAVAQAAGVVAEIALKLRKEGKDVKFAVHPVVRIERVLRLWETCIIGPP